MAATETVPDDRLAGSAGRRLIPVAIIVYIISFMDRTNIGFAFDGMGKDLRRRLGGEGRWPVRIFFIGYLVDAGTGRATWPNGGARRSSSGS